MKKLMLFSMWLAASAAAVGVAWAGVSVVDNQVVDPPSAAGLASPVPTSIGNAGGASEDPTSSVAGVSSSGSTTLPVDTESGNPSSSPTQATTPAPTPSSTPASQQAPKSPTTTPSTQAAPTTQTAPTTAAPTAPPAPAATTQTFTLTGGTAAISFSSSGVEVLWATPNPGFEVKIEPESPGIKVEFRADHHRSRVDAWWSGGPQSSIREEPRN